MGRALTYTKVDEAEPAMVMKEDQYGENESSFQTTILLVEDEAPIRLLMWHILNRAGYRVHLATDGFDALRKLPSIGEIDLLVTDLSMPGMTGIQLARQMRDVRPELKVVYATGSQECFPETRSDITCVTKPFTVDELLSAVRIATQTKRSASEDLIHQ